MKTALVYDRVNKWGGAERVLLALHKIFPEAPLFTSVYDRKTATWADVFEIKTSFLQKLPSAKKKHEFFAPLMPIAFESFDFDGYDLVISITSEYAKGIITKPGTKHICYCLTPTRYLWSGYDEYFANDWLRLAAVPFVAYLRSWDKMAATRPDVFIAISNEVKKRIKKYYNQDSEVIYPPLTIDKKSTGPATKGDYFLLVSRLSKLTPYKKVELAIDAFNHLGYKLKIVGSGRDVSYFKSKAKSNIEFLGNISDSDLADVYTRGKALIFPGEEDFGLAIAESQYFGTPVVAYKKGGALEIVKEGITGEFFDKQSVESLVAKLEKFDHTRYNSQESIRNSEKFTFESFKTKLLREIEKTS